MLDKIIQFIIQNKMAIFIPLLSVILILFILTIIKRRKLSIISLVFTFFSIGIFVVKEIVLKESTLLNFFRLRYLTGLILFTLALNSLFYLIAAYKSYHQIKMIQAVPSNVDTNIYAYLNRKSKLIMFTEQFYQMFSKLMINKKAWFDTIKSFEYDKKSLTQKEFIALIKIGEEKLFKFDITLKNSEHIALELMKKKIIIKGKLFGYILINQKQTLPEIYKENLTKEYKKRLYIYLDLLDEAIAFFENEKKKYTLSSLMMKMLGLNDIEVSQAIFEKNILNDDLKLIQNRFIDENINKSLFRMNTVNGVEWFEQSTLMFDETQYVMIKKADFTKNKVSFKGYNELLNEVRMLVKKEQNFALALISFDDVPKISDVIGKDASDLVVVKYFRKLAETELGKYKVFKIGKLEYAILIDSLDNYENILRDLRNNVSELLGVDIYLNELKFGLNNSVGIVLASQVEEHTAEAVLKAGFDTLFMANDDKYAKSYSIYVPKKSVKEYADDNIDLSDSFLDKLLNK